MTVDLVAPAKLTWTLRITGVRPDGYHLIDAEMFSLDLVDRITLTPSTATDITVDGPYAVGVPTDGRNLCHRALDLVGRTARMHLHKAIPHGGGLGGGSTDAAAVLRWAGMDDVDQAVRIGADVPFCLHGGRARVTGIGERIEPLPHIDRVVTLVIPPVTVSTPAVYRAWDDLGGPTADGPNDLEPAALAVEPALMRWRDLIGERCGEAPILAGSGATWFVPGRRDDALADLVDEGALVTVAESTARY